MTILRMMLNILMTASLTVTFIPTPKADSTPQVEYWTIIDRGTTTLTIIADPNAANVTVSYVVNYNQFCYDLLLERDTAAGRLGPGRGHMWWDTTAFNGYWTIEPGQEKVVEIDQTILSREPGYYIQNIWIRITREGKKIEYNYDDRYFEFMLGVVKPNIEPNGSKSTKNDPLVLKYPFKLTNWEESLYAGFVSNFRLRRPYVSGEIAKTFKTMKPGEHLTYDGFAGSTVNQLRDAKQVNFVVKVGKDNYTVEKISHRLK